MKVEAILSEEDRGVLDILEKQLAEDIELYKWWQRTDRENSYAERFDLIPNAHDLGGTYGFFDTIEIGGRTRRVMGVVQDIFYDQVKAPADEREAATAWMRDQVREFALRYYMRIESRVLPQRMPELCRPEPPAFLKPLEWYPPENGDLAGFRNRQRYRKPRGADRVEVFPEEERRVIVDLREIGPTYDWVLAETDIFDFNWTWTLGSAEGEAPTLSVPVKIMLHLVFSPELIVDREEPEPGIVGEYGPGVAFLRIPGDSLIAYGPDKIQPAFEQVRFQVLDSGQVRVRIVFVCNQPDQILNLSLDPIRWGVRAAESTGLGRLAEPLDRLFDRLPGRGMAFHPVMAYIRLASALSAGRAARTLGISRTQLNKEMLFLHCVENYKTLTGTLPVWNQVRDWLDPEAIPDWVALGRTS